MELALRRHKPVFPKLFYSPGTSTHKPGAHLKATPTPSACRVGLHRLIRPWPGPPASGFWSERGAAELGQDPHRQGGPGVSDDQPGHREGAGRERKTESPMLTLRAPSGWRARTSSPWNRDRGLTTAGERHQTPQRVTRRPFRRRPRPQRRRAGCALGTALSGGSQPFTAL